MLSDTLAKELNKQISYELFSSVLYLQMSSWCLSTGMTGCASFLRKHSEEEMVHMYKIYDYVNNAGTMAIISTIEQPTITYTDIYKLFEKTLEHECTISIRINALVDMAVREKNYSTANFLQWYVIEQHEEETLFQTILDRIQIIGKDKIYFIDKEVEQISSEKHEQSTTSRNAADLIFQRS